MAQALGSLSDHWAVILLAALLLAALALLILHRWRIKHLRSILVTERRLKDLIDRSPMGIVVYRNRALLYANAICLRLFDQPSIEEMARRNPMDFYAPQERQRILGYIRAREMGEPAPSNYEVEALRSTGESFPMAVHVSQVELRDGAAIIMFLEDATERKAARAALEKSERDYRGLFENAHDAIVILEPEGEHVLDANERACQMYGLPREEFVGRSLVDFTWDVPTGKQKLQEIVAAGKLTGYQTSHRRADGTRLLLDINASMVDYQGQRAVLSIQRDITERLEAEEALRKREESYRLLIENQKDILVKLTPSYRITFASPSFCRTFGKSLGELVGGEVGPLIHEEDLAQTQRAFAVLKSPPHQSAVEHRLRTKDGWRWFSCSYSAVLDDAGALSSIVGTGQDVTDRKAAEDALRESEQRFRALTESSTAAIFIYQDERIVYANRSTERVTGYAIAELVNMDLAKLLHPDYRDLLIKRAQARQRGEPVLSQYEAPILRKDGTTRWLLISAARILHRGQPAGIIAAFDVTERRDTEERLRQSAYEIQAIIRALPDLYFRVDSEGRILDWRSGRDEDMPVRPEEFTGKRMQEVLPPEVAAAIARAHGEVQRGARMAVAEYSLTLQGREQRFEARLAPLFGQQAVAVVRNVTESRRAQAEIGAWKLRFDLVSVASGQVVYDYDVPSGGILWSGSVEQVLGYEPAEMGDIDAWSERIHPDDRAEALRLLEEAERDLSAYDVDYRFRHKDGHYVTVHDRGFFLPDDAGHISRMVGMMTDVTEYRHALLALRQSEERFRRTFDLSPVGAAMLDMGWHILRCNRAFCTFLGYEEKDIVGRSPLDFTHPEDLEIGRDQVQALVLGELDQAQFQKRYLRKDGQVVWGELTVRMVPGTEDRPAHFLPIIQDITERKRAEDALNLAHARLRAFVDASFVGILVARPTGEVVEANDYYLSLVGYTREEMDRGEVDWRAVTPPEWLGADERALGELKERGRCAPYEKEYLRRDGTRVSVLLVDAMLPGPENQIAAFALDVTDRKRAEEQLRETTHFLTEAQRIAQTGWYVLDVGSGQWRGSELLDGLFGITALDYPKTVEGWLALVHPADRQRMEEYFLDHVLGKGNPFDQEYRVVRVSDRAEHWVHGRGELVRDGGKIVKMIGTIQDITERRRVETALRQSDERFRTLFDSSPDPAWIIDGHRFVECNQAAIDMLGYPDKESLRNTHPSELSPEFQPDGEPSYSKAERMMFTAQEKGIHRFEWVHRRWDKSDFFAEVTLATITIEGRQVIYCLWRDITERKQAEEELRLALHRVEDEKAKTEAVIASIGDGISIQDLDFKVIYQNEVHKRVSGDRMGQYCYQAYDCNKKACEECPVALAYADGKTHTTIRSTSTPRGTIHVEIMASPLRDHTGAIVAGIECVRDITERRQAEAALVESERRLRKIIDQSPISMAIVAMDGTIEYINRKAVETFGFEQEDIPTMERWWMLAYPDEAYRREVIDTYMGLVGKALAENRDIEGREYRVTCKDGSVKTMFIFGVPVAEKVFVMFQDVTERKRAEEALRARLEQHRALVENARAIILQFDPDLKITYWNDFAAEFFGFTREEALGASLLDTVVPRTETSGRDLEAMIRDLASDVNRYASNINENVTKDGRRMWVAWSNRPIVDEGGRLTTILSIGTDITELKRAEAGLAESEKRLRLIYENVQEIIYYNTMEGDPPRLKSISVSPQVTPILGYEAEDFRENFGAWFEALHPDDAPVLEAFVKKLKSGLAPASAQYRFRHKLTGEYHWMEDTSVPDLDAEGQPKGFFGVVRDITERRRAEEELRLRNTQLLALAASADAMGQFLDTGKATQAICDAAIRAFGATMAWVGLVVPESTEVTPLSSAGKDEGYTAKVRVRWDLSERAMGPTGKAIKTRKPQVMHVSDPAFAPWREEATKRGFQTVCALPIMHGEEVRGVITIYSDSPDAFTPDIFDIFEVFARQCAMVLVNAALYEEARSTIEELWAANEKLKGK